MVTAARSETGATARTRRCARPSSLIWVVTTLRSVSIASGNHCLLDTALPALNPDLRSRFLHGRSPFRRRSPMHSRRAGRMSSGTTLRRRSILIASLDDLVGGRRPCRLPASVDAAHRAGGGPVACAQSLERLAATSMRVRARPVVGRRQPAVAGAPFEHRIEHALGASSGARSRPGGTPCSTRRRRPCRCAAACRRRSRGTRRRSGP